MTRCVRCLTPRTEESFYTDGSHPDDICKPCIHRPRGRRVRLLRSNATSSKRTQTAICYVVKHAQINEQPFVYLVKSHIHLYKIGFSTNVSKRVRQLETAGGRPLEQQLHYEFRSIRIRLEWFRDTTSRIAKRFSELPGSMVFLPEYLSPDSPLLGVTE